MYDPKSKDPHNIIGKEIPAADGGNYGYRVLGYNPNTEDYTCQAIRWNTGEILQEPVGLEHRHIDVFKITYRYQIDKARPNQSGA